VIALPRALARQFRAVLRRSLMDQVPRGDWPLVLCRAGKYGLTLQASQGDLALRYHRGGAHAPEAIAFRAAVLAEFEGRRDDPVELEQVAFGKGQARWTDGTVPRVIDLETVVPESAPEFPGLPRQFTPMPAGFLQALDEAAKTIARDSVRFALTRLQLRGKTGEIVATDGRQLLVQGGFTFPWSDTVLAPRVPAFGIRELAGEGEVGVGRTRTHVAVKVGAWTFLLAIDTHSRFPDVNAVIPKASPGASRLHLNPQDAAFLITNLPRLPGGDDDHAPVTLDLHRPVTLRGRDEKDGITELVLIRSTASGPPVRLGTDRRYLLRAAKLGFDQVAIVGADQPLVCRSGARVYVWVSLDRALVIPPEPDMRRIPSAQALLPPVTPEPERSDHPMPAPQPNGQHPDNSQPSNGSTEPERWGIAEVIAETEALRGLLHDASARTARLLAALKHQRRRSRAVQQAMQSLKQLQFDR
jgi:hypothetical protein